MTVYIHKIYITVGLNYNKMLLKISNNKKMKNKNITVVKI